MNYAPHELPRLHRYLDDGRVAFCNNHAERCIKPFTIGMRNWPFANTPDGARASAGYCSVIEKANGLDPYRSMVWLFTEMPVCADVPNFDPKTFMTWNAPVAVRSLTSATPA